jgi:hypothetical protein
MYKSKVEYYAEIYNEIIGLINDCGVEDWDGIGAEPITIDSINKALIVFSRLYNRLNNIQLSHIEVIPCGEGNICLEYHMHGGGFSLSTTFTDKYLLAYSNILDGEKFCMNFSITPAIDLAVIMINHKCKDAKK